MSRVGSSLLTFFPTIMITAMSYEILPYPFQAQIQCQANAFLLAFSFFNETATKFYRAQPTKHKINVRVSSKHDQQSIYFPNPKPGVPVSDSNPTNGIINYWVAKVMMEYSITETGIFILRWNHSRKSGIFILLQLRWSHLSPANHRMPLFSSAHSNDASSINHLRRSQVWCQ